VFPEIAYDVIVLKAATKRLILDVRFAHHHRRRDLSEMQGARAVGLIAARQAIAARET